MKLIKTHNIPLAVTLNAGEKAEIEVAIRREPNKVYKVNSILISKYPNSLYRIEIDGKQVYPPSFLGIKYAEIPPSDIDAPIQTFFAEEEIINKLVVIIQNLDSAAHTYGVKIIINEYLKE